jgi:nucleoside-triphosphatase THEP1
MANYSETTRIATIYNPQNQTKTGLINGFVVRQKIFNRLFNSIKEAKMMVPEQHYLLLGRRGIGKTTMLLRLAYEIENTSELQNWLLPVVFNEEEYGIRRLFNFWERIMDLLGQQYPIFAFDQTERKRISALHKDDDAYERALFEHLMSELNRNEKKIILFIDNFGDILEKFSDFELHRLRKILQGSPDIRLVGASSVVLDALYKYDHPFYEFFQVEELKGLSASETHDLLISLSQHYKKEIVAQIVVEHPGRVEALRRITGGVIRTMVLLFEIFADDEDGTAFQDLETVLDRLTPFYKHRIDDLSTQQQAIVEIIARNWDGISVKELVEATRLDSKTISAQLQILEKNGVVEKRATMTKNHLYLVSERFFNVWFLMRSGQKSDEKRVQWLVHFFEEWCGNRPNARPYTITQDLSDVVEEPPSVYGTATDGIGAVPNAQPLAQGSNPVSSDLDKEKIYITSLIKDEIYLEKETDEVADHFTLLLAKNQAQWLCEQFASPAGEAVHLKDRFKPIYYAALKVLDHPDFLRMGDELRQTVDEVIEKSKKMALKYA